MSVTRPLIEIRPEVAIYAAFARLNYRPWYALAEFVDNALQSFLANRRRLAEASTEAKLHIGIRITDERIEVEDDAAGIPWSEFPRAFLPASPPPDISGLSEYGLGMKAAACWFARKWSVRTIALGDDVQRSITFDIPSITSNHTDRLPITDEPATRGMHGALIILEQLNVRPRGRAIDKIKRHLASIYRMFLRDGSLDIRVNGESLAYEIPEILEAPLFTEPRGNPRRWKREFSLELDEEHRVWGWAGILHKASVTNAGFAIFRRSRLIEGSYGEAYRPEVLFRKSNSYTYQRLVGEVFVEGFTVSHTKDGVQWSDWEEDVLNWLRAELDRDPVPLLKQAEGFRVGRVQRPRSADVVVADTQQIVVQRIPPLVDEQLRTAPDSSPLSTALMVAEPAARREVSFHVAHAGQQWQISLELVSDETIYPWLDVAGGARNEVRQLSIRINLAHPFMIRFSSPSGAELQPLVRIAVGIAIAESTARATGVDRAGTIRRNLNQLLREALSAPTEDLGDTSYETSE